MKQQFLTFCFVLMFGFLAKGQGIIQFPLLKKQLDSIATVDKKLGQDLRNGKQEDKAALRVFVTQAFIRHTLIIKDIFKQYGFPHTDMVGTVASQHFMLCVQHSDHDLKFQDEVLKAAHKYVKTKKVNLGSYAFLRDRTNINMGKAQVYGTQIDYDDQHSAQPKKLKNPGKVNERRKSVELEPLEEYLEFATAAHRKMNHLNKHQPLRYATFSSSLFSGLSFMEREAVCSGN